MKDKNNNNFDNLKKQNHYLIIKKKENDNKRKATRKNIKILLLTKIEKLRNFISNQLYPSHFSCIFCGEEITKHNQYNTCEKCYKNLPFIKNKQICLICGSPIKSLAEICEHCYNKRPYYNFARAVFEFDSEISKLVQAFKYNNSKYLFKPLSFYMANIYKNNDFNCDFIVPVPLSKEKYTERGYNQSLLLAKQLSYRINIPIKENLVVKIRQTLSQTMLKSSERKINLENAYEVTNRKEIKNKTILIVDDVMTTGSTINTISKLLINYGAKEIQVLTLAKTNLYKTKKETQNKQFLNLIFDKLEKLEIKYKNKRLKRKELKTLNKQLKSIKEKYEKHIKE